MNELVRGYVGLGSNLGDRLGNLRRALLRLAGTPGVRVVRVSPVYETAPWGYTNQPSFLNAVAEVESALGPIQLATALQAAERGLGRTTTFRWGPREIDLDLLLYGNFYGDRGLNRRGLAVPHPAMHERAFVLAPLADLRPDYQGPGGETIAAMLARLVSQQPVARLAESLVQARPR